MASLGYAKGPALVIDDVSQIHQLSGHEILVLKFCEPSMSAWLLQCQGLILEQGNPLSHGAIVAREMGVPCIYGVYHACQKIQNGEWIEFNAIEGKIQRCSVNQESLRLN